MSGKILIQWRHSLCVDITKVRYTNPENTRAVHTEIANIFFNPDGAEDSSDDTSSCDERSHTTKSGKIEIRPARKRIIYVSCMCADLYVS